MYGPVADEWPIRHHHPKVKELYDAKEKRVQKEPVPTIAMITKTTKRFEKKTCLYQIRLVDRIKHTSFRHHRYSQMDLFS